jgi:hypothetical protein
MSPPLIRSQSDRVVNFVAFVSRDGLTAQQPCGKPQSQLTNKAFRVLRTGLVGVQDERSMPKPEDADFRTRTREYTFDRVEVQRETGITTAIYLEAQT